MNWCKWNLMENRSFSCGWQTKKSGLWFECNERANALNIVQRLSDWLTVMVLWWKRKIVSRLDFRISFLSHKTQCRNTFKNNWQLYKTNTNTHEPIHIDTNSFFPFLFSIIQRTHMLLPSWNESYRHMHIDKSELWVTQNTFTFEHQCLTHSSKTQNGWKTFHQFILNK